MPHQFNRARKKPCVWELEILVVGEGIVVEIMVIVVPIVIY